jgi:hypothetical protein
MSEPHGRIVARLGLDPEDNAEFAGWLAEAKRARRLSDDEDVIDWFLDEGWPWPETPVRADDRDELRAYLDD